MDRMYKQIEYDTMRGSKVFAPDGAFLALNEQGVYVNHTSNMDFEVLNQSHNSVEIIFCEEGEANYYINKEVYSISKNDILIIGAMDFHFRKIITVPYNRYGLTMLPVYMRTIPAINDYLDIYKTQSPENYMLLKGLPDREFAEYIHIIRHLWEETRNPKEDSSEMVAAYIHVLTLMLKRTLNFRNTNAVHSSIHQTMLQVKDYININYKEDLSLEKLGELFYFQPGTISKYFKLECGTNIKKYINTVRVSNAVRLLEKSDISIEALAVEVGYTNVNTFLRQFSEMMQTSPLQYRKKFQIYLKKNKAISLS